MKNIKTGLGIIGWGIALTEGAFLILYDMTILGHITDEAFRTKGRNYPTRGDIEDWVKDGLNKFMAQKWKLF